MVRSTVASSCSVSRSYAVVQRRAHALVLILATVRAGLGPMRSPARWWRVIANRGYMVVFHPGRRRVGRGRSPPRGVPRKAVGSRRPWTAVDGVVCGTAAARALSTSSALAAARRQFASPRRCRASLTTMRRPGMSFGLRGARRRGSDLRIGCAFFPHKRAFPSPLPAGHASALVGQPRLSTPSHGVRLVSGR